MLGRRKINAEQILSAVFSDDSKQVDWALGELLKMHRKSILHYVTKWGGNAAEGEDVLMEGIAQVYYALKKGKFRGESSLNTYIFQVCKFIWMRKNRKKNPLFQSEEWTNEISQFEDWEINNPTPVFFLLKKEEQQVLDQLFRLVPKACAQVLEFFSQCMPFKEIAEAMGFQNAQVAMNKKSQCLGQLRSAIENNPGIQALIAELGWKQYNPK